MYKHFKQDPKGEEKKLTDDEIVKALDICYTFKGCTNECPYFNKNGRNFCLGDKRFYKDLKGLIHRLQSENERLTEENEYLDMVAKQALTDYQNTQVQVDELNSEKEDLYFQKQNLQTYIDNHEPIWKRNTEQAVKDTAKEIYRELIEMEENPCNSREEIYQAVFGKRGVEVE